MARWPAAEQPLAPLFDQDVSINSNGFIPCGVCSVAFEERAGQPDVAWAICPHRLLTFGPEGFSAHQHDLGRRVLRLAGFDSGAVVDVWSEITLRDVATNVNYRLDYVLKGVTSDAPPVIVEVMTASTSGGNKKKGTDIQSAFCDAVLYAYKPGEVNVVVAGLEETGEIELYAGPIGRERSGACWSDLLAAPGLPAVDRLLEKLAEKDKVATLEV